MVHHCHPHFQIRTPIVAHHHGFRESTISPSSQRVENGVVWDRNPHAIFRSCRDCYWIHGFPVFPIYCGLGWVFHDHRYMYDLPMHFLLEALLAPPQVAIHNIDINPSVLWHDSSCMWHYCGVARTRR